MEIKSVIFKKVLRRLKRVNNFFKKSSYNNTKYRREKIQNESKYKHNNKYFCWISAVRVLLTTVSRSPPLHPQEALQYGAGLWTFRGDSSYCSLALLLCVFASTVYPCWSWGVFFFENTHCPFYIFHRHRVRLDCVDLIYSLYIWWEGFRYFSSPHCPWGLPVVLSQLLRVGHLQELEDLCGSGAAAWIVGTLAAPGTQECWWPQEQNMALLGFSLASGSSTPVRIRRALCKFFIRLQQGPSVPCASVSGAKHKTSQCLGASLHETVGALANWAEANWSKLNAASRHVDESKRSTRFQHRIESQQADFLGDPHHRFTEECVFTGP